MISFPPAVELSEIVIAPVPAPVPVDKPPAGTVQAIVLLVAFAVTAPQHIKSSTNDLPR
jgi:hypothetical protein